MTNEDALPSDAVRLSRKVDRILPAFEVAIKKLFEQFSSKEGAFPGNFEKLLEELLPFLNQAFYSNIAFMASEEGNILFCEPQTSHIRGMAIPKTDRFLALVEKGEPLVAYADLPENRELKELGVQSLLIVRIQANDRKFLIGVCDGNEDPPYEGLDTKFLRTFSDLSELGSGIGRAQAETRLAYERYIHAKRKGEYSFLSRASEDSARFKLRLRSKKKARPKDVDFPKDVLLADYLDAELCLSKQNFDPNIKITRGNVKDMKEQSIEPQKKDQLLIEHNPLKNLVTNFNYKKKVFGINLKDNKAIAERLPFEDFPKALLAIARICMWDGYIAYGARIPSFINRKDRKRHLIPINLQNANAEILFFVIPHKLMIAAKPKVSNNVDAHEDYLWQLDWLRTCWQYIHYIARNGSTEPILDWVDEVDLVYRDIRALTTQMTAQYLSRSTKQKSLQVDSDWLILWLVNNVLLSSKLAQYHGNLDQTPSFSSPAEKMRYFTHLSHLVLYALHCIHYRCIVDEIRLQKEDVPVQRFPFVEIPPDPSLGLSESHLYVLSEYAYHEIGVPRELNLLERLVRQLRYELPLYAANEFYRDHLYHVVDVCLLGELILRSWLWTPDGKSQRPIIETLTNGESEQEIMQNWYIASLCHDLGYVVEKVNDFLAPVKMISGAGLDEFFQDVENGLKSGGEKIKERAGKELSSNSPSLFTLTEEELKKTKPTDHGLAAWLHLNHWLRQINIEPITIAPALNAILRHNLYDQKIDFSREPLTWLLMLCDHLQEWGRPRIGPDPLAREIMESMRFSETPEFIKKVRTRQLSINGIELIRMDTGDDFNHICDDCWKIDECLSNCPRLTLQIDPGGLEFELSHVEAREGDFEPAISWLLMCRDLQCFSYDQKPLPMRLKIILAHTPSRIWAALPWRPLEMDLIQEYASGYEPAAYLCEWVEKARCGDEENNGISYTGDRNTGQETFTIFMNRLNRPLRRGLSDEQRNMFYKWKWQRIGQQYTRMTLGDWFPFR